MFWFFTAFIFISLATLSFSTPSSSDSSSSKVLVGISVEGILLSLLLLFPPVPGTDEHNIDNGVDFSIVIGEVFNFYRVLILMIVMMHACAFLFLVGAGVGLYVVLGDMIDGCISL